MFLIKMQRELRQLEPSKIHNFVEDTFCAAQLEFLQTVLNSFDKFNQINVRSELLKLSLVT